MYVPDGYNVFSGSGASSASAGSFVPNEQGQGPAVFKPSPEGKKLLDYYLKTYNVPLEIRVANMEGHPPEFEAFFTSGGVGPDGYGGSLDPKRRVINVNPQTTSPTVSLIAHEASHAYDPSLPKIGANRQLAEQRFGPALYDAAFSSGVEEKPRFLRDYIARMGPADTMAAEVYAQVGGRDALKKLGMADPESESSFFRGYPMSYVEKGVDAAVDLMSAPRGPKQFDPDFFQAAVFNRGNPTPDGKIYSFSGDTVYDYGKSKALKLLDTYLTPGVLPEIDNILNRADTYTRRVMGSL